MVQWIGSLLDLTSSHLWLEEGFLSVREAFAHYKSPQRPRKMWHRLLEGPVFPWGSQSFRVKIQPSFPLGPASSVEAPYRGKGKVKLGMRRCASQRQQKEGRWEPLFSAFPSWCSPCASIIHSPQPQPKKTTSQSCSTKGVSAEERTLASLCWSDKNYIAFSVLLQASSDMSIGQRNQQKNMWRGHRIVIYCTHMMYI